MKFLIKLFIVQILAIIQPPILKTLNNWISTHYNWYPELLYQIFVFIAFGLLVSFLLTEWSRTTPGVRIITMILGVFNLFIGICSVASFWSIPVFSFILIGVYLFFGISLIRDRRKNR